MAKFLLDTTALIDFSKGWEPAKSSILELIESEETGVCAINIAEFFTGLSKEKREQWQELFELLYYWDIDPETAKQAGIFRYDFLKKGKQLTTTDALIAATAYQEKAVLITNNIKDFPMSEISIMQIEDIN